MMPFVLLDNLAKEVYENRPLSVQKLTIGISRGEYDSAKPLRDIVFPDIHEKDGKVELDYKDFPIEISILEDKTYIREPDTVFYAVTQFYVPNPFKEYWKNRKEVK